MDVIYYRCLLVSGCRLSFVVPGPINEHWVTEFLTLSECIQSDPEVKVKMCSELNAGFRGRSDTRLSWLDLIQPGISH